MLTLSDILTRSTEFLKEKGNLRARRTAEELIGGVLNVKRLQLYMQFDRPMEESELAVLRTFLKRAAIGEPVEYILGEVDFYHCNFELTSAVLIPRPETEILVDMIYRELKEISLSGKVMWDLCSGSGCIGISLKKALPDLSISLVDISSDAVALAKKNCDRNQVDVQVFQGDLLAPFSGCKADIITCNPPYISLKEYSDLDPSVRNFEPKGALVGGERGLDFYERLSGELPAFLHSGAKLYFELGSGQGEVVNSLFSAPCWKKKRVERDWAGHDRFFFLEFE